MNNIHFIWCGPNKGAMCVETANIAARVFQQHQIIFWCFQRYQEGFKEELEERIKLKTIESLLKDPFGRFLKAHGAKVRSNLADVVETLMQQEAYSAAKDLVCLLALHEYGGYYLDTTTSIVGSAGMSTFASKVEGFKQKENTQLTRNYPGPRFAWMRTKNGNGWNTRPIAGLQTGLACVGGALSYRNEDPELLTEAPIIDVWAAYSPVGDPHTKLMLLSYISRANRLGINSSKTPRNLDNWNGYQELSNRGRGSVRNDIIGELVIGAVLDGLFEATGGKSEPILGFAWDAFEGWEKWRFPPNGLVCVPELGIVKEYKNSWR
ncbi:hypothetical protein ACN28S_41380 [Cystobacter fuscus]